MKKFYLFLFITLFSCVSLFADWTEMQKILASDGAYGDSLGYSVSINGDYAVIGAFKDDDNGEDSGSAYIFQRVGSTWSEQTKITASEGASFDYFGYSVSIDGDYSVIGVPYDNVLDTGSAYIFHSNGNTWTEQAKITASDGDYQDRFGSSVSIHGDYVLIGAPTDDWKGSAYIFHRNGTTWTEQVKLTASDGEGYDDYGYSVSISGDYAVIGVRADDDNGANSGSAYIFYRNGITWSEQAKITASDGAAFDFFGYSVSISGDYAVFGAYGDDDNGYYSGSAYMFHRIGITWSEQAKIIASDGDYCDIFGKSVSISGDYAVISAYRDDDNGYDSGSAYIFYNDGVSVEEEHENIIVQTLLIGNYPNPFNPFTTISFTTEHTSLRNASAWQAENTELIIYNLKGQKVKTFPINSSTHTPINSVVWDGRDENNQLVENGIYFYTFKAGKFEETRKMILLK